MHGVARPDTYRLQSLGHPDVAQRAREGLLTHVGMKQDPSGQNLPRGGHNIPPIRVMLPTGIRVLHRNREATNRIRITVGRRADDIGVSRVRVHPNQKE